MTATYLLHPLATLFPDMQEDEYRALVEDIRVYGQHEPVILWQGQVIDGRHRLKACEELGIPVATREWHSASSPTAFVVSENMKRRHLTPSQRATVAADVLPFFQAEARERQGARRDLVATLPPSEPRKARDNAGREYGVSPRYVQDAKKLKEDDPERFAQVRSGALTLPDAMRQLRREEKYSALLANPDSMELGPEVYSVVYADPPWRYEVGTTTDSRVIENQYPTMSIEDICAFPIGDKVTHDAVLFLWATSPLLEQAWRVLVAWGFEYKTSWVWVKPHIGMGYYGRVRHEFVLIGTRGNGMTPFPERRPDSVFTTAERLAHSEKPGSVREAIDAMYPGLAKIELFARAASPGWVAWGLEAP